MKNRTHYHLFTSIFSLLVLTPPPIFASPGLSFTSPGPAASPEMYVVDMQKIIDGSISGKAARNNMETDAKKAEAKLAILGKEIERLRMDLEKQTSLLSVDALHEKRELLTKRERVFQRERQDIQEDLGRRSQQELSKVVQEIRKVIDELANKEGYPLVVERDPRIVLYVSQKYDLTDTVLKLIDERRL